jgi:hypothetical protein
LDTSWVALLLQLDADILTSSTEQALAWLSRTSLLSSDQQDRQARKLFGKVQQRLEQPVQHEGEQEQEQDDLEDLDDLAAGELADMLRAWCCEELGCADRGLLPVFDPHIQYLAQELPRQAKPRTATQDEASPSQEATLFRVLLESPWEIVPFLTSSIQSIVLSFFPAGEEPLVETLVAYLPEFPAVHQLGLAEQELKRLLGLRVDLSAEPMMYPALARARKLVDHLGFGGAMLTPLDVDVGSLFALCKEKSTDLYVDGVLVHNAGGEDVMQVSLKDDHAGVWVLMEKKSY